MKKALYLGMALAMAAVLAGCGGTGGKYTATLGQIQSNLEATVPISDKMVEIAKWQVDESNAYWDAYDEALHNGEDTPESEDNTEEVQGKYDELQTAADSLGQLLQFDPGQDTGEESIDKTSAAYRKYMQDMSDCMSDMKTVFDYYFAVRDALKPITDFSAAESTTGYDDYALYAGQLSQVISQSQKLLSEVQCPAYVQSSHDALVARIDEFQSFSQDFSIAVQLSDPLRISSCYYRSQRLETLLDMNSRNLDNDFNLQFNMVVEKLEGSIAKLRGELSTNIQALTGAKS